MEKNTIIIVDDSDVDANLATMALKCTNEEFAIHHLKDGQELVEYLTCKNQYTKRTLDENQSIRLILLDINMPRMSGLDALKLIRETPSLKQIPIAMLTSSDAASDILNSYHLGANSYIKKAIDFEEFRQSMNQTARYWINVNQTALN